MADPDESFFEELKRYVGFDDADGELLRAFHPVAEPHFEAIAEEFYDALTRHPAAARVLSGAEQIQRLKGTLQRWMSSTLTGPWNDTYYESRARIGHVHVRVTLPQRYMFTAMNLIRAHFHAIGAGEPAELHRAVDRILDIELAIMLETYRAEFINRITRIERRAISELEAELARSEARYMTIVENAAALVLAIDNQGHLILFNHKAEAVTGFERAEVLGADCVATMCHPRSADRVRGYLRRALAGEQVAPFDACAITKGGDARWVRWHLTPLGGDEGIITAVGIDITDERELERRTRRAEQLAGLGTLAAGLAHEIRNPLNAANLQLMLVERRLTRGGDDNRQSALESARVVKTELERLAGLVQDFLAFARPTELRLAEGDLCDTVQTVISLLQPQAAQTGVTVTPQLPDRPVAIRLDEERIKQVIINLVRNAVDAAGPGGEVVVRIEQDGDRAVLRVEDTGPGVPEDLNIFEPFATTKEGGTGLGLPIVHRIITDHGGNIDLERTEARTIFVVDLPIAGP